MKKFFTLAALASTGWIVIGLAFAHQTFLGKAPYSPTGDYTSGPVTGWGKGLIVIVLFWIAALCFCIFRSVWGLIGEATVQIPSPAQIEQQLRAEGYNPTLQDVLAVEQHLRNNRNDALIGVGALWLALNSFHESYQRSFPPQQ
jgi:hypothetical protein